MRSSGLCVCVCVSVCVYVCVCWMEDGLVRRGPSWPCKKAFFHWGGAPGRSRVTSPRSRYRRTRSTRTDDGDGPRRIHSASTRLRSHRLRLLIDGLSHVLSVPVLFWTVPLAGFWGVGAFACCGVRVSLLKRVWIS